MSHFADENVRELGRHAGLEQSLARAWSNPQVWVLDPHRLQCDLEQTHLQVLGPQFSPANKEWRCGMCGGRVGAFRTGSTGVLGAVFPEPLLGWIYSFPGVSEGEPGGEPVCCLFLHLDSPCTSLAPWSTQQVL